MNVYLRVLGTVFLLFQQIQAVEDSSTETDQHLVEKGSKSESKSKVKVNENAMKGPQGPTGAPGASLTPVYASAHQKESVIQTGESVNGGFVITVPFSTLESTRGISLNADLDTFTFPKGIYTVRFGFVIRDTLTLNPIYLDIGGSQLNLAWNPTAFRSRFFTGSTVFQISEDDTKVKLCVITDASDTLFFDDDATALNYPTSIVFEKIADIL